MMDTRKSISVQALLQPQMAKPKWENVAFILPDILLTVIGRNTTFIASNVFLVLRRTLTLGRNGRTALTKRGFQGGKMVTSFQI